MRFDHGLIYEAVPGAGVRCVPDAEYFPCNPPERYAFFVVAGVDEAAGEAFARLQLGKRYDWRAILGFATLDRATRERAGYWQCAEFAYAVIARAGVPLFAPGRTNPRAALALAAAAFAAALISPIPTKTTDP